MVFIRIGFPFLFLIFLEECLGLPGHDHVHHKIHVPTKVRTIYHTKIIKVPEHHYHIKEKEKPHIVKVPEHHHYFHEKEKEKHIDFHDFDHKELEGDSYQPYENDWKGSYSHNVPKKQAAPTRRHKKKSKNKLQGI